MLKICQHYLKDGQKFVTNVGETAFSVIKSGTPEPEPNMRSNAGEGDLRVWLHCQHPSRNKKFISAPTQMCTTLVSYYR